MSTALRAQTWVPEGLADLYYPATAWRRSLEAHLARCLEGAGYQEVCPCLVETWEEPGVVPEEAVVRVLDEAGRVLALRSDFTPAVARVAVTLLERDTAPVRLWYAGPVFRRRTPRQARGVEMYQVGAEIVGLPASESQAIVEVLQVAAACLRAAGLDDIACVLGASDLPERLLRARGAGRVVAEALACLREGDAVGLERCLLEAGLAPAEVRELYRLFFGAGADPRLAGHLADTQAGSAGTQVDPAGEVKRLAEDVQSVFPGRVRVSPGLVLGPPYYDGPVFELYTLSGPAGARRVGSGGRYRLSVGGDMVFGMGFALDLDEIMLIGTRKGRAPREATFLPAPVPCGID